MGWMEQERQGQSYARVWEVWRRCQKYRVGGTKRSVWITEDSSIGVRTWLQLMCCALAKKVILDFRGDKQERHKGIVLSGGRMAGTNRGLRRQE